MDLHELSAVELRRRLDRGELRSEELVRALHARREAVDPAINGWVHRFDEQALLAARLADQERAEGRAQGVLHGLPFSIKENLATPGLPQTLGIRARLEEKATGTAVVVQAALREGGIALGKSNVPLLLLAMETHNEIWGTTRNPWDLRRTPGGSSGGEAALIASGQVPLGLGTDIGGSIRIPAAWCGICGLKPTVGRWSLRGSAGGIPGQESVRATTGPMARGVEDLILLWQALSEQHSLDPRVPPLPLDRPEQVDLSRLRVGVYVDDGVFAASLPVARAVREAADTLRAAGVTVVDFQPPDGWALVDQYFGAISADGTATAKARVGDQPPTVQLKTLFLLARLPAFARLLVASALEARGDKRVARMLRALGQKSVQQLWAIQAARAALQEQELAAWQGLGLDLVLCPPTVTPAALLDRTGDWSLGAWPTMRYNILDLPAGVAPVSTVREDEQQLPVPQDSLDRRAAEFLEGSAGLPVAVQVVGKPWQEGLVLAAMAAIERGVRDRPGFPRLPVTPRG